MDNENDKDRDVDNEKDDDSIVSMKSFTDMLDTVEPEDLDPHEDDAYMLDVISPEDAEDEDEEDHEELDEARVLNVAQRLKLAQRMRRLSKRFAVLRKLKSKRMALPDRLRYRARKAAIMGLRRRVAGSRGQDYNNLTRQEKISIDQQVARRFGTKLPKLVDRIAVRLMPFIRRKEAARVAVARGRGNSSQKISTPLLAGESNTLHFTKKGKEDDPLKHHLDTPIDGNDPDPEHLTFVGDRRKYYIKALEDDMDKESRFTPRKNDPHDSRHRRLRSFRLRREDIIKVEEGFGDRAPDPKIVADIQREKKRREDAEKQDAETAAKNLADYQRGRVRANWGDRANRRVAEEVEQVDEAVKSVKSLDNGDTFPHSDYSKYEDHLKKKGYSGPHSLLSGDGNTRISGRHYLKPNPKAGTIHHITLHGEHDSAGMTETNPTGVRWRIKHVGMMAGRTAHDMMNQLNKKLNKEEVEQVDEARKGKGAIAGGEEGEGGDTNIVYQLRKVLNLRGNHDVKWEDGSKSRISMGHAQKALEMYHKKMSETGPGAFGSDKQKFVNRLGKNENSFHAVLRGEPEKKNPMSAVREGLDEKVTRTIPQDQMIIDPPESLGPSSVGRQFGFGPTVFTPSEARRTDPWKTITKILPHVQVASDKAAATIEKMKKQREQEQTTHDKQVANENSLPPNWQEPQIIPAGRLSTLGIPSNYQAEVDSSDILKIKQKKELDNIKLRHEREKAAAKVTAARKKMNESLEDKAEQHNIPYEILEEVFNRGIESCPESYDEQRWAFNRVNSFIAGGYAAKLDSDLLEIIESSDSGLAAKARKSGISIGTLKKVYRRGVAAWNSGHRPGTTPQQWGMARVNSYITKGKTFHTADKDLHDAANPAQQAAIAIAMKKAGKTPKNEDIEEKVDLPHKYRAGLSDKTAAARKSHWEKMASYSDRDPKAYEPAPGDKTAKTKESKYTKKYREMYGEAHVKVGDNVHLGFGAKGGTGFRGTVTQIDGDSVHIKNKEGKTYKGPHKFVTKEEVEQVNETGGPQVWKKGNKHIEKYSNNEYWLYVDGKKNKQFSTIEKAKEAATKEQITEIERTADVKTTKVRLPDGRIVFKTVRPTIKVEAKKEEVPSMGPHLPFDPDPPKKLTKVTPRKGQYGSEISRVRHLARQAIKNVKESFLNEVGGAGFMGTDELRKKYASETPGQTAETNVASFSADKPWVTKTEEDNHDSAKTPKTFQQVRDALSGKREMKESFTPGIPDAPFAHELGIKTIGGFAHHPTVESQLSDCCEECVEESTLINENVYRVGSEMYFEFFNEKRRLYNEGRLQLNNFDASLMETDIGTFDEYEGNMVPLDCPMIAEEEEKNPPLNQPRRGGTKKFYVYVRDPSTGNVKKVSWGDTTGLSVKMNNPEARKSFAARHGCGTPRASDRTKAAYWACNTPRYAKQLGLSGGGSFYW